MSAVAAEPVEGDAPPAAPKKARKKLIIIAVAVLVVLAVAAGAAVFMVKKRHAAEADADDETASHAAAHRTPPTFLPLEPFVVNLADRDNERFAQIGITLELDDPHFAEELKVYMPAIRNGILMVMAHKTSQQLLDRAGKEALAAEIMHEVVRPLGLEFDDDAGDDPAGGDKDDDDAAPKGRVQDGHDHNPVRHVHFSSFIIQ